MTNFNDVNPFDILSGKAVKTWWGTFWFKEPGHNIDVNDDIIGKLHRENDLPAAIFYTGTMWWCVDGHKHRENGPAVFIAHDKTYRFYLNGNPLDSDTYMEKIKCLQEK